MGRLTEKDAYWLEEEFWTSAKEPDDEQIDAVYMKLKEYEDLEEQGLLLKLPCRVGDTVAIVLMIPSTGEKYIEQVEVKEISIGKYHTRKDIQLKVEHIARRGTTYKYYVSEWGKNIFPTLAEAEKALAEMEKKDE